MTADDSHNEKITTEGLFTYQLEPSLDFSFSNWNTSNSERCYCREKRRFLWMWSHLLKKSLMENFIFCAVMVVIPTNNDLRKFLIEQVFFNHRATVLGFLIFNMSCFDVILHTFCIKRTIKEFIKFIELQ